MFGMLNSQQEPMSKVDSAWLRMESPTNPMMITGIMIFSGRLDVDRFKRTLRERFLTFKRFTQKAVDTDASTYWEFDPDFDLDTHVRVTALPGQAKKVELEELTSELASTPLDASKPRWQFHVVENYERGTALISRIHHCYADGIALVQVLLSLTDLIAAPEHAREPASQRHQIKGGTVMKRLESMARKNTDRAMKITHEAIARGIELITNPLVAQNLAKDGSDLAYELANALLLSDDPDTVFRGILGVRKRCAWADPLPLKDVKAIAQAQGVTVNDLLVTCLAGAFRGYLVTHHGETEVDGIAIRCTVPVNLRPLEHARDLGNHFGLVYLELPVGEANPLKRLEIVRRNMNQLKSSKQAAVTFGLLAALGMAPGFVQKPAFELFSRKASAVMTNVPGPQQALFFGGSRIEEMMFWVPQTGSIGMGASILSYNDQVYVGLITDRKLVPDPDSVVARFRAEFEKIVLLTLITGASGEVEPERAEWLKPWIDS